MASPTDHDHSLCDQSYEAWCTVHCYFCGRTTLDRAMNGPTPGCLCAEDPDAGAPIPDVVAEGLTADDPGERVDLAPLIEAGLI